MILLLLTIILLILELSTYIVYGGFISKETNSSYLNLDKTLLRINQFDKKILSYGNSSKAHFSSYINFRYITTHPFSLFSKYHISGLGTVPRWSKLHRVIKEYYKIATENDKM